MIDPDVRVAVASDTGQLEWLEAEARHRLVDQRGGQRWLETHDQRTGAWPDAISSGNVVVAHIDDVIVGYLVIGVDVPLANVDEVYVTPQARELGFGDAMLGVALARARSAGCSVIEGEALPGDRDTKNLYERAAIKARLITVSAEL